MPMMMLAFACQVAVTLVIGKRRFYYLLRDKTFARSACHCSRLSVRASTGSGMAGVGARRPGLVVNIAIAPRPSSKR